MTKIAGLNEYQQRALETRFTVMAIIAKTKK